MFLPSTSADTTCPRGADDEFGPRIAVACRTLDFTLLFEDAIFTVIPATVFLLILPWRLWTLWRTPVKTSPNALTLSKLGLLTILLVCHVLFLTFRLRAPTLYTKLSITSAALSTAAIAAACLQSFLEDRYSLKPSDILIVYLSLSAVLSIPRLRSLWIIQSAAEIKILWTVTVALTVIILVIESRSKANYLRPKYIGATKEQTAGFWNRSFFIWVLPFFQIGSSKLLQPTDIPAVDDGLREESTRQNLAACWERIDGRYRLVRAVLTANMTTFLSAIAPRLCLAAFTLCQPFLIEASVSYLASTPGVHQDRYGPALVGAFVLVNLGIATSRAVYWRYTFRLLAMTRCGLISILYQHTTTLNSTQLKDTAAMTLMGTDVERIVETFKFVHELWASIPEIGVAVWLLARQISAASVVPLVICIASLLVVSTITRRYGPAQRQWVECVQKRVTATASMLLDIKSVKMLGLTSVLHDVVSRLREVELKTSEYFRSLLVWQIVISNAPEHLAPFATFTAYAIIATIRNDETLFSAQAFTSLSLINLVTGSLLKFCQALPAAAQALACFGRIEAYLCLMKSECRPATPHVRPISVRESVSLMPLHISESSRTTLPSFQDADIAWSLKAPEPTLRSITVGILPGFTAIIGPVASGKSTFLASILGETALIRGSQTSSLSRAAFCPQVPWIMNSTIRHNITGGLSFDRKWYDFAVWSCCLEEDLSAMPRGDQTMTGSSGASLSGGQRQRLALARAVYSKIQVVLLDDVTSGLDSIVTGSIISRLFSEEGHFRKAGISVILATHNHRFLPFMDQVIIFKKGQIVGNGPYADVLPQTQGAFEGAEAIGSAGPEEPSGTRQAHQDDAQSLNIVDEETTTQNMAPWRQDGSGSVYRYYYQSASTSSVLLWSFATIISAVAANYSSLWLQRWVAANEREPNQKLGLFLGVYGLIFVISTAGMLAECWIINDTALKLHDDLLRSTLRAPLSFFSKSDAGTIINRFNQDMDLIDMTLPSHAIQFTTGAASCVAQLVILCILGKYLTAAIPVLAGVLFLIQRYYLRTSRQVRLLDIEAKAPLYKHFLETTKGISTIRAFGWESASHERHAEMLNASQRPFYMLFCIQQWLILVLDLTVGALMVILVAVATSLTNSFEPGSLGVALVLVISLSALLTQTIQAWTKMETSIGAVARVQQFVGNTPRETTGLTVPSPDWPTQGSIQFDKVTAGYTTGASPSLMEINLKIAPGERVAVCGASGSGKSSLVMALLQMMNLQDGRITIDGVDISTLHGQVVRSRINVVSQDPYFIPGTVRLNIDPRLKFPDERIESTIQRVGLWGRVCAIGGLDADLNVAEWSHGEKQLLCLARALLVSSPILVLDEATSSLEQETEASMQEIIDSEFRQQTIISVTHRFTYLDRFDRIIVLDRGRLIEYGAPQTLLRKGTALFRLYTDH